jgi:hypothetical protein
LCEGGGPLSATTTILPADADRDDFDDGIVDGAKWSADDTDGRGTLTETNGRLEYSADPGTRDDLSYRRWIGDSPRYEQDWEARIEIFNSVSPAGDQAASFGIQIINGSDPDDSIQFEMYDSWIDTPSNQRGFYSELVGNGVTSASVDSDTLHPIDITSGTIRLSYDSAAKVITVLFDLVGGSIDWVELGSFGLAGSGGQSGNVDWQMSAATEFSVAIYGISASPFGNPPFLTVSGGQLYGDNFILSRASEAPGVPTLSIWTLLALFSSLLVAGCLYLGAHPHPHRSPSRAGD